MSTEIINGCGCCNFINCIPVLSSCASIDTFGSVNISSWKDDPDDYSIGILKFDVNGISDDNADIVVNNTYIGTVIGHVGPPPNCTGSQFNGGLFLPTGISVISNIPCDQDPCYYLTTYGIRTDPNNKVGTLIYNSALLNDGKSINTVQVIRSNQIPSDNFCGNYFKTWIFKIKG